jgi:PIN domain
MCVIVDANLASQVFAEPPAEDFSPVMEWVLEKGGMVAVGGRLAAELERVSQPRRFILSLLRSGRARRVPDEEIVAEELALQENGLCISNDCHVLALVRLSGARTVCTLDRALQQDVRNARLVANPRGSVYQRREHAHLLKHTRSCGQMERR